MYAAQGYLVDRALAAKARIAGHDGQATVEYLGIVVVVGTGLGLVAGALGDLNFAHTVGKQVIGGITHGIGALFGK